MIWLLKSIFLRYREHNGCQGWFMDRCHTIENWGSAAKPRHLSCQVDIYAKSMHYRYRCIVSIFHLYIFQIHQHKYLSCNSIPWSSGCQSLFHVENSWWFTFWWHCRWGLVWWVLLLDLLQLMTNWWGKNKITLSIPFFPWKTYPSFWTSFLQNPSLETKLCFFF